MTRSIIYFNPTLMLTRLDLRADPPMIAYNTPPGGVNQNCYALIAWFASHYSN